MDRLTTIQQTIARLLARGALFLDTETTGLDGQAELCEISVLDSDGLPLIDTLICPSAPIPPEAAAIHGITDSMIAGAPVFPAIYDELRALLIGRPVIAYNAAFDGRMIDQTCKRYDLPPIPAEYACAMLLYSDYSGNRRWQSLGAAAAQCGIDFGAGQHRAATDARIMREIVYHMVATGKEGAK